ncbi:Multicopper oxidase [Mycena sanguinolenta]|uniref:laccase n=1 Tax=Mycena sanguinolenta TaxID=230812 RepID=A0A8H7DC95_9AGAR|nr:Multicopper oxidase [Mycena sanguinolenta]
MVHAVMPVIFPSLILGAFEITAKQEQQYCLGNATGRFVTVTIANLSNNWLEFSSDFQLAGNSLHRTVLAGGTFPGPLITGNKGSHFRLNVEDGLTDITMERSTTIHWHSLFQRNTSWADGAAFVARKYLQIFRNAQSSRVTRACMTFTPQAKREPIGIIAICRLSTATVFGEFSLAFTIRLTHRDVPTILTMAKSTVITLADWYHYVSTIAPLVPPPNSTLINGLGRYQGGPASPLALINVVDGTAHKPLTVDSIQIFGAQLLDSPTRSCSMQTSISITTGFAPNPNENTGFDGGIHSAILRYVGTHHVEPATVSTTTTPLVETALSPLIYSPVSDLPYPGGADVNINLNSFTPPSVPVLLQILGGAQAAQALLPEGNVYTLPPNKVIEISIPSGSAGAPHPFHLHGHTSHVIRSAGSDAYNFDNPIIRDVVSTGPSATDNTTFRFVTDNAGPWYLHRRIDWYLDL